MLSLNLYPKSTYISSFNEYANYYYKDTLLVGNSRYNEGSYITILKFSNFNDLEDINIINATLNITLLSQCAVSINELSKNIKLCTIVEDFNIQEISWNNPPKVVTLNLDESDYSFDKRLNILSFNISSVLKDFSYTTNPIYGLALLCKPTFRENIYKFYSSNSSKPPFIAINYEECRPRSYRNLYNIFEEKELTIESNNSEFYSEAINIHNFNNGTYFIKNLGTSAIIAHLQISPDGINFVNDVVEANIMPGESVALALAKFLKFSRVRFINQDQNTTSLLQLWLQGQTLDYHIK